MEDYHFVNFSELRNQKRTLLLVIAEIETAFKEGRTMGDKEGAVNDLTGILNLIDSLQDHAVDVLGIPEMEVYDFEAEEERNKETPEEIFARENAQTIFEMRIEGEGLYMDDEMSGEFIRSIVDNEQHASAIKNVIRLIILEEVQDFPNDFQRDADGKLTYDYTMYDYGYAIEGYCRKIFYNGKTKDVWVCRECGSDSVESHALVNPNAPTENPTVINLDDCGSNYCFDCQKKVVVEKRTIPYLAKNDREFKTIER